MYADAGLDAQFVPPPRCSFAALWAQAEQRGAPANAVATITYDTSGYDFAIRETSILLRFDSNCRMR